MNVPTQIHDVSEVLNRQVHPVRLDPVQGVLWEAFNPGSNDGKKLSTLRGHVSAEEAHRRHTQDSNLKSVGTWGVSVGESHVGRLICMDDGGVDDAPADHASIDFNGLSTRGERQQAARKLCEAARLRGPLYTPVEA